MFSKILTKVIGSRNDRTLRKLRKIVDQINKLEPQFESLQDEELGDVLENSFYSYVMSNFKPLQADAQEFKYLMTELPKLLSEKKKQHPNNFLLQKLIINQGEKMDFLSLPNNKNLQKLPECIADMPSLMVLNMVNVPNASSLVPERVIQKAEQDDEFHFFDS